MQILIAPNGTARCIYGEALELSTLGRTLIKRASHVEPDEQGRWWAHMAPVGFAKLGPFAQRSQALAAEQAWLNQHWLHHSDNSA